MKKISLFLFLIALIFPNQNVFSQESKILVSEVTQENSCEKEPLKNNFKVTESEDIGKSNELKAALSVSIPSKTSSGINYLVKEDGFVTLKIFDDSGKEIASLINRNQAKGSYFANFSTINLETGIYTYQLSVNNSKDIPKLILVK